MTSENTVDLVIPPAAADAWFTCGCSESGIRSGYKPEALPVVAAAELRRIADEGEATGLLTFRDLRARADELDPGTPATTEED